MSQKSNFNMNTKIQNEIKNSKDLKPSRKKGIITFSSLLFIVILSVFVYTQSEIEVPNSAKSFNSKSYIEAKVELKKAGFYDISIIPTSKSFLDVFEDFNDVEHIEIDGKEQFSNGDKFKRSSKIKIFYYSEK